ncbi:HNH endonuclease signature motif containing protein [Mycobacterium sp. JS623]|uniref:HNH endonuclease signature motif containing protein n=1 Tax=Mycobacterium sp. JS623 TaxID=212767 RepID=UPI00030FC7BA|nr:HNH endonuclease signature motif containing protein [Mycobacterium sp. JS623]
MFDGSLPEVIDLSALDDAALVDAAAGWARTENAACARKLAVMAELFTRRTGLSAGEREDWWVDPEAAVGAELAAAQNVSTWMALAQAHRGVVLADRLPQVAALFEAGLISEPLVRAIEYRTLLVTDAEAIKQVDALLADQVMTWGPLSVRKTEQAIDAIVAWVDPGALRRSREMTCQRDVRFGSPSDEAGYTSMWALLSAADSEVVKQRVEQMARSVCEDDPRTLGERRSEALTAISAGIQQLACQCENTDCQAAQRDATPPATAVIHVVAEAATVDAARAEAAGLATRADAEPDIHDGASDGDELPSAKEPEVDDPVPAAGPTRLSERAALPPAFCPALPAFCPAPAAAASCSTRPAFVLGGGVLPTQLLAPLLERATVREIRHPGDAPPEPRYTPSRALADFVRCRDLTCRWPGCDKPADGCDLDHTVPYPIGRTHASNLKCYCRFHHLLKTFYCGVGGWREQQLPDGTLILTSPTGHTYTTKPGSVLLFPTLCRPTGTLWAPGHEPTVNPKNNRGLMMPKRKRIRAEKLARRIDAERRLNDEYVAERNKPPPF